jgi:phosphoribosyl-ATP pyrophosphohydrolase/phosphoribosyl-AMP cyclohydrolase
MTSYLDAVAWNREGLVPLVPVVVQEKTSHDVLMLAWMNPEALAQTLETGYATYYSRSRQKLWKKGESSGHTQRVHRISLDCDGDALLIEVTQEGHLPSIACHTGRHSCFYQTLMQPLGGQSCVPVWEVSSPVLKAASAIYEAQKTSVSPLPLDQHADDSVVGELVGSDILDRLAQVIESRRPQAGADPSLSYVAGLLAAGPDRFLKKIGEEATELVIAAKQTDQDSSHRPSIAAEMADLWFHCLVVLAHYGLHPQDVLAVLQTREGLSGLVEKAQRA